jgi:hypothetical protein
MQVRVKIPYRISMYTHSAHRLTETYLKNYEQVVSGNSEEGIEIIVVVTSDFSLISNF